MRAMASSTFTYCSEKSSLVMPSLTLSPSRADRWWISRSLSGFFGTVPRGEATKFRRGGEENGPAVSPRLVQSRKCADTKLAWATADERLGLT